MHKIFTLLKNVLKRNARLYQFILIVYYYTVGIFKRNGVIRNYCVFPLLAFLRVHKIPAFYREYEKLDKIRERHQGERIFVIATGPSLTSEDVEKLEGEITISVNTIFRIFDRTEWRPTYYMIGDPNLMDHLEESGEDQYKTYSKNEFFLSDYNGKNKYKDAIFFPVCWLDHMVYYGSHAFKYTKNLLWGTYCMYTVTNTAINLAHYMGAREIYLLGADCNYSGAVQHVGGNREEEKLTYESSIKTQEMMTEGYKFIKREMDKAGVQVFNATRGGNLEIFPRVKLEDVLK